MKSIIKGGNDRECWFCGRVDSLEKHHCLHGTANRKLADKYGLWVYLCSDCHRGTDGVHGKRGKERDLTLKKVAQRAFEEKHTRERFRELFGRSYLELDYLPTDEDKPSEMASERGCGC